MNMILSTAIAMVFACGCMKLNMSPDRIMFVIAIIFAGGLAGMKD